MEAGLERGAAADSRLVEDRARIDRPLNQLAGNGDRPSRRSVWRSKEGSRRLLARPPSPAAQHSGGGAGAGATRPVHLRADRFAHAAGMVSLQGARGQHSYGWSWGWGEKAGLVVSLLDDALFHVLYAAEAVVLSAALCGFFLCCGCHI
ncbi:hypothetical protein GUJ93_ZPchr0001g31773 [Zizania palustris]|uniref:Uncharacterized protein n=1 Tax=Zizania palustris TaxID=103762 RepID=A0A8J5SDB8_ZIZPA|nr:hypothetical protein GUJ93_ZPchr0001g31773 [Zizania palustris]